MIFDGADSGGRPVVGAFARSLPVLVVAAFLLFVGLKTDGYAEPASNVVYQSRVHSAGDIWLNIQASGTLGSGPSSCGGGHCYNSPEPTHDLTALRIDWQPSFEFPGGSKINYLYLAAPMVGAIKGFDTLVSTAFCSLAGFQNEFNAFERISESSSRPTWPNYRPLALADQEYYCRYSDTAVASVGNLTQTLDEIERRLHKPIGLEVSQTSRSWAGGSGRRFIIFDLWIRNISGSTLRQSTIGITIWPGAVHYDQISHSFDPTYGSTCGLVESILAAPGGPSDAIDTVNIAWFAHIDGHPERGVLTRFSPTSVVGYRILRASQGRFSFNWWASTGVDLFNDNWGPWLTENRRDYAAQRAWPLGDRSLYQTMTNGEIDYDQMYAAKDFSASGWSPPYRDADVARSIASGDRGGFLHLSVGPLPEIAPGDSVPFTYALIVGENFHTRADNFARNFNPYNLEPYRDNLDFSDLILNARLADWYFDNPGVDTDGDGYAGKFYLENCRGPDQTRCDTVWYKGDGIPDWGGPKPPAPPKVEVSTQPHRVTLRWSGEISEIAKDQLSRQRDFEGYRVYSARVNTADDYALIASWDLPDNFRRVAYDEKQGRWSQISHPLTVDAWRLALGDPEFDPVDYTLPSLTSGYEDTVVDTVRDAAGVILRIEDRLRYSYWEPQGPNHGNSYPDADGVHQNLIQRVQVRDTVIDGETLLFGDYEMELDNLNAAIPLWFSVTTLDHGDYKRNLDPLESAPNSNATFAFPVYSADVVSDSGLQVTVYPNPYKIAFADARGNPTSYYDQGFEAYGKEMLDERDRRIWFANLPDTATIHIYSLDGDLIREIHHPDQFLTRYSSIVGWDLVSRNTQAVTSGIYIWKVDSRLGSQVGKIVIIK